jgi:hypothetical protein
LRQARAVAHQSLYQIVRQRQPSRGPKTALPVEAPAEKKSQGHPGEQEEGMRPAPRSQAEDRGNDEQFQRRDEPEKPAAQSQRFHRFGLKDTPQELAGAQMTNLLRLKPQGPGEEALLEETPSADGEQAERHQRRQ